MREQAFPQIQPLQQKATGILLFGHDLLAGDCNALDDTQFIQLTRGSD